MIINPKHNRAFIIGLIFMAVIMGAYLNRSYAHIYSTLQAAGLKPVDYKETYYINNIPYINNTAATSSLIYSSLGDSLTAGVGVDNYQEAYPYLLATKLSGNGREIILKNHSFPGANTIDLINDLLPEAIRDNPDIVTVLIGVNDIHNQVPLSDFKDNYEQILSQLTKETKARIYVVNIPFIGADTLMLAPYQFYFDRETKKFNAVIRELAIKYKVNYVDLYTPTLSLFKKSGDYYSADLFHPSASGYKLWAEIIYDNINK